MLPLTISFAIFIIFLVLPASSSVGERYETCSSSFFSCGKNSSDVGYPFWGGDRPKYCGHPSLQLQCLPSEKGDRAQLILAQEKYAPYDLLSMKINYPNIILKLRGYDNITCTTFSKKYSDLFDITSNDESITLIYNCPKHLSMGNLHDPVPCFGFPTHNYEAYYLHNMSAIKEYASCSSFEFPVLKDQLDLYNQGKLGAFTRVLKHGFEVRYKYSSDSINCTSWGGTCGSSDHSDFVCFYRKSRNWKLILGIGIPGGVLLLLGLNIGVCCYFKLRSRSPAFLSRILSRDPVTSDLETGNTLHGIPVFSYTELQEATNNFDAARELGDGGFGIVYYGKLRDGREVAVKRLYEKSFRQMSQFMNEIEILTGLRHPNLVTLYGCTSRHSRELLLVYEYISNGTVADHLYGEKSGSEAMTWAIRMKIAIETASALSYLHNSEIVHRDVKTNNILLTDNFSVKVADFGLSRLFPVDATHVSTAPQGTPGYLDPEYHKCYQVTNKSDVYSFGVVLVELVSSLPAVDIQRQDSEINLSDYAMNRIQRDALNELVDKNLGYNSDVKVRRMISLVAELAFQCLQQEKEVRPSMTEVLEALERIQGFDYTTLEAEEMDEKRTSVDTHDTNGIPPASPSSVIDNWAIKSNTSNPSG
ncbi:LEAF RUST 10 DISEASE-RESISTANCE LOCUS RECEPTOR-LIKE PROTEIN KINASE-like 1.2 [Silene latifolia]|uniref:LEAF RUST 10 DISEASE-RESISTANCE LOCUS RECEPTOR-LIKE PROTEIN KINASE-like 1.2 n=1 Tax=Silene latifolia TaxID=37657 RepID=UPI003D76D31F